MEVIDKNMDQCKLNRRGTCIAALAILLSTSACASQEEKSLLLPNAATSPSPLVVNAGHRVDTPETFRKIDFSNFTFPAGKSVPSITLVNGKLATANNKKVGVSEIYLQTVAYDDVTGDGAKDALVVLGIVSGGSATPHHVYLYSVEEDRPKFLWRFTSGDRADGGLRKVYGEKGELIVELYGKDREIGGELFKGDEGACCPSAFTRTRYAWNNNYFQRAGSEVLTNPDSGAPVLMTR